MAMANLDVTTESYWERVDVKYVEVHQVSCWGIQEKCRMRTLEFSMVIVNVLYARGYTDSFKRWEIWEDFPRSDL